MPLGKLSKGLVGSINPRFTDYSLPRVTAVLVGLSMLGGFVGILTANLRCTYTTSITPHNHLNHGSWYLQKIFINDVHNVPEMEGVERTVDMCFFNGYLEVPVTDSGTGFTELQYR
jgi:hypothetical protein